MTVVKMLLAGAAGTLLVATVFALSARLWWVFDLFAHFRLQLAALGVAFGVLAVVAGAWRSAAVLIVIALIHGWAIKDLWLGDGAATERAGPPSSTTLRVASANVLVDNGARDKVVDFARETAPDLLVLVEAQTAAWGPTLAAIGEMYPHRAPEAWRDGAPVVLFSRYPVDDTTLVRPAAGERPYLKARVAVSDRSLTVLGVHPASPSPRDPRDSHVRNRELDHLAASVHRSDEPVIVMGDFNTSPWSPHFRDLIAATGLRNAAAGHGWIATWPRWFWPAQIPIDHILLGGTVTATAVRRGASTGSDHYPVVADLRLRAAPEGP